MGQTPDYRMVRLRGQVIHAGEETERRHLIDMMFELNPSMKVLYPGDARHICDAFYMEQACGEYYDLGQKPLLRVPFAFGQADEELSERFVIGEDCTGCGKCVEICPAKCIELYPTRKSKARGADYAGTRITGHVGTRTVTCSNAFSRAPYRIRQEHCLRCGLCAEACPAQAIEKTSDAH